MTYIFKQISRSGFIASFTGRYEEHFSYEARGSLYDYLSDQVECTGEPLELDVIDLCLSYTEYENLEELNNNYDTGFKTIDELNNHTEVIPIKGTNRFIIFDF